VDLKDGDTVVFKTTDKWPGPTLWGAESVIAGAGPWWSRVYYGFIANNTEVKKTYMGWLHWFHEKYIATLRWYEWWFDPVQLHMSTFLKLLKAEGKWPWTGQATFFDVAGLGRRIFEMRRGL
jgi:hypothetical protein